MNKKFSPFLVKGIFKLLLTDESFCDKFFPILKPDHFVDNPFIHILAQAFWGLKEKYGEYPSDELFIEELFENKGANIELFNKEPSDEEMEGIKTTLLNILESDDVNKTYIEDNVTKILSFLNIQRVIMDNKSSLQTGDLDIESFTKQIYEASSFASPMYLGANLFDDLDKRTELRLQMDKEPGAVSFNIPQISDFLEDKVLPPGSLAFWMAPSNGGKSVGLIQMAKDAVMIDKINVLYVTAELSEEVIKKRFDATLTGIPIREVRGNAAKVRDIYLKSSTYTQAAKRLRIIEVPNGLTKVVDIDNILTRLEKEKDFKTNLLIVDYADLLRASRNRDATRHEITSIYQELRDLAIRRKIVVWTASQLNDQGTQEAEKKDGTIGIRHSNESRGKIHLSDFVIGIARTKEEKEQGIARLIIVKNRVGGGDGFQVRIFPDFTRARLFTGKVEEVDKVDIDTNIKGFDEDVAVIDESAEGTDSYSKVYKLVKASEF